MTTTETISNAAVEELFAVGAHYGFTKMRRHPSTAQYIFGVKNSVEIFDLEKTYQKLQEARSFVQERAEKGETVLFVSSKPEAEEIVRTGALAVNMPYVTGRWIGGTLTNFDEIRKRVNRLEGLREKKEKGELDKYTKHERLLMDREIADLEETFGGLVRLSKLPAALFVIDPKQEAAATHEAEKLAIPVVALANSDCDVSTIAYPIPANDSNIKSIKYFVDQIVAAYKEGMKAQPEQAKATAETSPATQK